MELGVDYHALTLWFYSSHTLLNHFTFQYYNIERIGWRWFQKSAVRTKYDPYIFLIDVVHLIVSECFSKSDKTRILKWACGRVYHMSTLFLTDNHYAFFFKSEEWCQVCYHIEVKKSYKYCHHYNKNRSTKKIQVEMKLKILNNKKTRQSVNKLGIWLI